MSSSQSDQSQAPAAERKQSTSEASSGAASPPASAADPAAAASGGAGARKGESSTRSAILRLVSDYNAILSEANDGCSASPVSEDNMVRTTHAVRPLARTPYPPSSRPPLPRLSYSP